MTIATLPSGRFRVSVYVPGKGNVSASKVLGIPAASYKTKKAARAIEAKAMEVASGIAPSAVTVGDWWTTWTTDPLWARPKESTNLHNAERTQHFARQHWDLPLAHLSDMHAAAWLAGGKRNNQADKLRTMFNDAASAKAGRLLARNPFSGLGISKGPGNADKQPPTEEKVWEIIGHARRFTSPYFTAWLQFAAFTGMRPGEIDALKWDAVDFAAGSVQVLEQFNVATKTYTLPKNGKRRPAILTPAARDALLGLPREGSFVFLNLRGKPMTPSSRSYHWNRVRGAAGWEESLYLATRHYFGWYAINKLRMTPEDVAIAMGHEDGGDLVRRRYGHLDRQDALSRVAAAFEQRAHVIDLDSRRKDTA